MKEDQAHSSQLQSNQSESTTARAFDQDVIPPTGKLSVHDHFTQAEPLSSEETIDLYKANKTTCRRQQKRIRKIGLGSDYCTYTGTAGRARCLIGVAIVLTAMTICFLSGPPESTDKTLIIELATLRPIVYALCIVGALLIFTASNRHRALRYILSAIVLSCGWFAPILWEMNQSKLNKQILKEEIINKQNIQAFESTEIELAFQEKNLTEFTNLCNRQVEEKHFALFITGSRMSQRRDIVDIINRFSRAKSIKAYTKSEGLLIVCENATKDCRNPREIAALFGYVVTEDSDKGIYGVSYENDIAQLENNYSSNILSMPEHVSYVEANIEELQSKVSERIRRAATSLCQSNTPHLRKNIVETLYSVLQDPWENERLTQGALILALVNFAEPRDIRVSDIAHEYIKKDNFRKNESSLKIIRYLVDYIPEEVTQTIIGKWQNNPIGWHNQLIALGPLAQESLILQLGKIDQENPKNILLINSILNYLDKAATPMAIASIRLYKNHKDALIRSKAESCIKNIKAREQQAQQQS